MPTRAQRDARNARRRELRHLREAHRHEPPTFAEDGSIISNAGSLPPGTYFPRGRRPRHISIQDRRDAVNARRRELRRIQRSGVADTEGALERSVDLNRIEEDQVHTHQCAVNVSTTMPTQFVEGTSALLHMPIAKGAPSEPITPPSAPKNHYQLQQHMENGATITQSATSGEGISARYHLPNVEGNMLTQSLPCGLHRVEHVQTSGAQVGGSHTTIPPGAPTVSQKMPQAHVKPSSICPNPLIKAAAFAAGGRIATPSTAASLFKAAQSKNAVRIRLGGATPSAGPPATISAAAAATTMPSPTSSSTAPVTPSFALPHAVNPRPPQPSASKLCQVQECVGKAPCLSPSAPVQNPPAETRRPSGIIMSAANAGELPEEGEAKGAQDKETAEAPRRQWRPAILRRLPGR